MRDEAEHTSELDHAKATKRAARQVAKVTLHQLHHSLARRLLQNGATLPEVPSYGKNGRQSIIGCLAPGFF
jgi:sulfur transfer protein SufE